MNKYYFTNPDRLVFQDSGGEQTSELHINEALKEIEKVSREYRLRNSIELFPHKHLVNQNIVYMTREEGFRDAKFCIVI